MTQATAYEPGEKTHKDENFPVASYLLRKKYRAPILAFYTFARAADDVADHPALSEQEKITQLDQFEATLLGSSDAVASALPLRAALKQHNLSARHAQDLLIAFRQDATQSRYDDWEELMQYCAYSAAPVGRFVLDVHGESSTTWPASDAVCSALQIINHVQDCKADYQRLNRIYIPQDTLAYYGVPEIALTAPVASPGLRQSLSEVVKRTQYLLSTPLSGQLRGLRLSVEIATIERLAHTLLELLLVRDPLSEPVHLRKKQLFSIMAHAAYATIASRLSKKGDA